MHRFPLSHSAPAILLNSESGRPKVVRIMMLWFAVAAIPCAACAQESENVERLVRAYFAAYQKRDWEAVVDMTHPESLKERADAILEKLPQNSADIPDARRAAGIKELLAGLALETPEAVRKLTPGELYLRILRKRSTPKTANAMKDVKTEIKNVSIVKTAGRYYVEVDEVTENRGKAFTGKTHFVVAELEGALKVVSMKRRSPTIRP